MKKIAGDFIILHVCQKPQSYKYASWDRVWQTSFLFILGHILPFYPTIDPGN